MLLGWVMGIHGCAFTAAHLQLSSGKEKHNQAELKWALGPWVGSRAQVRLARSACPPQQPLVHPQLEEIPAWQFRACLVEVWGSPSLE